MNRNLATRLHLPLALSTALFAGPALAATDWSQPPVGCVEEIVPQVANRPCLDLTHVANPSADWPQGISQSDMDFWKSAKAALNYCRGREILKREADSPGSQAASKVEIAWMQTMAVDRAPEKIAAVYKASRDYKVPAQVLTGALYQESIFAELGIAQDGNNYSCGIGQINIQEWCSWANEQDAKTKQRIGWPADAVSCGSLPTTIVAPFYAIALTRLKGLPEYRLAKEHFKNIALGDVVSGFPSGSPETQAMRYQATRSFIDNCSASENGVLAKANALAELYRTLVPSGLKSRETYSGGDRFRRSCRESSQASLYPLHAGWLLAVGMYNSGPRAVDALAYYNRWSSGDLQDPATFANFTPADMIEAFYWAGHYNPRTDRIDFETIAGQPTNWLWFKACVLQRHIARVVQNVTLPGQTPLVESLEAPYKCTLSKFDPATGEVIESSVPPRRQTSSGMK